MADRDHGQQGPQVPGQDVGRDWREQSERGLLERRYGGPTGRPESRAFGDPGRNRGRDDSESDPRATSDERPLSYGRDPGAGSASAMERYDREDGADGGGWGQPNLNSQRGQGGYDPLNQGPDYGQDAGRFGPAGYDASRQGTGPQGAGEAHDPHHASYHHWRDTQLSSHDRDYARWREEQARRYDEDYGSWRNERHSAFSKEFEGWRAGRGGQAGVTASAESMTSPGSVASTSVVNPSELSTYGQAGASSAAAGQGSAHGANPTLAKIADGEDGRHHQEKADKTDADRDPPRH